MTKLIRGQLQLTGKLAGSVITLGNFDGVHLGHQQLLDALKIEAARLQVPSVVLTFEPPPQRYFSANDFPRLMYWREKWKILQENQIDYVVCLKFNEQIAALSAQDFVKEILLKQLGIKSIIVGQDFRFGAKRLGDIELLRQLGRQYGFEMREQSTLKVRGKRVSSTQVRHELQRGNIAEANKLLGRPYFLCGRVVPGDQRGSQLLGFPTANIDLRSKPVPLSGIFVVKVLGLTQKPLSGVASLGVRPMFDGSNCWLEVHILDFEEKIYGKQLQVSFLSKLRDESCFASIDELIKQMHQDVANTRLFLKTQKEL